MRVRNAVLAIAVAAIAMGASSASAVDFHGYFRSGIGSSFAGGKQQCFQAPNADYKFRLGNECETYAEAQFDQTFFKNAEGVEFKYSTMLAYISSQSQDYESFNSSGNDIALRQIWVGAKLPQLGGASLWAGKRYFMRQDVHMIDYFYWDPSGPGAGIEEIDASIGKIAISIFQNRNGDRQMWRPDIRLYNVGLGGAGSLSIGYDLFLDSSPDSSNAPDARQELSHWLNAQWSLPVLGGRNNLTLQWANGSATPMSAYPSWDRTSDSSQFRVVEDLVINMSQFSLAAVVTYADYKLRYSDDPANAAATWNQGTQLGIGVRPIYHFNDLFSLAVEVGYNSVTPKEGTDKDARTLYKVTPAFIVHPPPGPGGAYFTRPELRLFVTYAGWNDAAKTDGIFGQGGCPGTETGVFKCDANGITAGIQVESWW